MGSENHLFKSGHTAWHGYAKSCNLECNTHSGLREKNVFTEIPFFLVGIPLPVQEKYRYRFKKSTGLVPV